MSDQTATDMLSDAELAAFVQKLDTWAETLSDREQQFLRSMLVDAADAATQDPGGFANLEFLAGEEGDVAAFGEDALGDGVAGAVVGYALGVNRSEAELQTVPNFDV